MKQTNNIEELINSKLQNYESEVKASVWDKIEHNLDQIQPAVEAPSGSESIVASSTTSTMSWVAGISAGLIGAATVAFFIISDANKPVVEVEANSIENVIKQPDVIVTNELGDKQQEALYIEVTETTSKSIIDQSQAEEIVVKTDENKEIMGEANQNLTALEPVVNSNDNLVIESSAANTGNNIEVSDKTESFQSLADVNVNSIEAGKVESYSLSTSETNSELNKTEPLVLIKDENNTDETDEQETLNTSLSSLGPVPNIFTPNGDGLNDQFIFPTENIEEIQISIYDLRGSLVMHVKQKGNWGWDGTLMNGQPAPTGNYYFAIYAKGFDNKMHEGKGTLYLNR